MGPAGFNVGTQDAWSGAGRSSSEGRLDILPTDQSEGFPLRMPAHAATC